MIEAARHSRHVPLRVNGASDTLFRREPASGLLLSVCDPAQVREALDGLGIVRSVTEGDLLARGHEGRYPSLASAPASDRPTGAPEAIGGTRRRPGALVASLVWLWFAVLVIRALQRPHGPFLLVGMLGLALLLGYARRRGTRLIPPVLARVPFAARALLLYPLIAAGLLAMGLALGHSKGQLGAAYIVASAFGCGVVVLLDASSQHARSSARVAWAIATALPAIAFSGLAFMLVH